MNNWEKCLIIYFCGLFVVYLLLNLMPPPYGWISAIAVGGPIFASIAGLLTNRYEV